MKSCKYLVTYQFPYESIFWNSRETLQLRKKGLCISSSAVTTPEEGACWCRSRPRELGTWARPSDRPPPNPPAFINPAFVIIFPLKTSRYCLRQTPEVHAEVEVKQSTLYGLSFIYNENEIVRANKLPWISLSALNVLTSVYICIKSSSAHRGRKLTINIKTCAIK